MILNVLIIMRKVNDYGAARAKKAHENLEQIDLE